jgi:hypothetical protein
MNFQKFTTFKTILIALVLTINANQLFSQTTNGIFFQAVARDNFSNPAKDRKIYVQSSIIQTTPTGTKVLTEEHQANTDATGVFSISLGNGVRVGGTANSLGTIDWSKGPFYLNLKVAITPIGANSSWDYNKEWVDMGTTSFGAVPFALYSASSAKVDDKLNVSDTTTMLKVYAKAMSVKTLETSLASKLTAADTLTMLAPYAKAAYTIDSSFFKTQLATKLSLSDSAKYVTQTQLAAKTFDQTPITNAIATKLNIADSTKYVTPTQLAAKTFDQTPITNAIATKLNIADSTKYITPTQLASYNFSSGGGGGSTIDTSSLSRRINLKANVNDLTSLNTNVTSNTSSITANTTAITSEAATARVAELVLTNSIASNTSSITAETTRATAAELTLTNSVAANTASISANTSSIIAETTRATAAELTLTNNVASNTSSITANAAAIVSEAVTARAAELTLTNNVASNSTSITAINTILSAATSSNTANTLVIRDLNGNFSAGSITASNYVSTPIGLSYSGSTINWNPTVGANAAITLTQNSTLSFSSTPAAGSYGTLVITQDATGSRTITLPSTANIVLGSTSTTTVALSTTANAKDILNFYYDGTNCYWNIGQGYGASQLPVSAATLTTARTIHGGSFDGTANVTNIIASTFGGTGNAYTKFLGPSTTEKTFTLPDANATILTNNAVVTVAQGGTGATTLTGLVKGNGTNALTAAVSGTDYQAPLNLTTTGTGAATLSGTTINIPTPSAGSTHTIGESYGGGIVFYVWDDGAHGLIAATADLGSKKWGTDGTLIYSIRDGIGAGKYNTERIIQNIKSSDIGYTSDYTQYAAYVCATYKGGNFADWYLPSKYELNLLYLQKTVVGGFSGYYWTSSEYASRDVTHQNFTDGDNSGGMTKSLTRNVRPIRIF